MLAVCLSFGAMSRAAVTLTDSGSVVTISAGAYHVEMDAQTGAFFSIAESSGGDWLARTFYPESPWVVRFGDSEWVGPAQVLGRGGNISRAIQAAGDGVMAEWTYALDDAGTSFVATMRFEFADDATFRGRFSLQHQAGQAVELHSFPGYVEIPTTGTDQLIFPYRGGVVLNAAFLASSAGIGTNVPGGFTPFLWWRTGGSSFAMSNTVEEINRAAAVHQININRNTNAGGTWPVIHYDQLTEIAPGGTAGSGWILFQVGEDAAAAARTHWDRGETAGYPPLSAKVSAALLETLTQAPLLKYPGGVSAAAFLGQLNDLPVPALIHVAGYMEGGHDESYPDYFPPDSGFGTMVEMQQLASAMRGRGSLFMPYTNPTWWDDESATMAALGTGVVAKYESGTPIFESYDGRGGYVVTPWHPGVIARLEAGYEEFVDLQVADLLFEDQVGARNIPYDGNAASPEWWSYSQGTLENTRRGIGYLPLMTELSWDRLAETQTGFCGNLRLTWEPPALDPAHFDPFPLAVIMANHHAMFYPHNLAGERMVRSREELHYNAALGYNMAYDLLDGTGNRWLRTGALVQKHLLARVVGVRVAGFDDLRGLAGTTRLTYDNGAMIDANWSTTATLPVGDAVLGEEGFWFAADSPRVEGGWIQEFGADSLGDPQGRLLILEQTDTGVRVLSETDEALTIAVPRDWLGTSAGSLTLLRTASDGTVTSDTVAAGPGGVEVTYGAGDLALELVAGQAAVQGAWLTY